MTIDKTMQLVAGVDAYNSRIDLASQPTIDYVSVAMLGRACDIFLTASIPVRNNGAFRTLFDVVPGPLT